MVGEETQYRFGRVWRQQLISCAVVAVMILSGLSVFLGLASGPAAAAGPFRSLRIGINPLVITTLNPLKITLADEYVVVYNVYSTLISYDKTYHAIPDLATHWSLAPYHEYTNTTTTTVVHRKNANFYGLEYYCQESRPDEVRFNSYSGSTTMVNDFLTGATALDALIGIDQSDYKGGLNTWSPKWAVSLGFVGEISINVITPALAAAYGYAYTTNPVLLNDTFRHAVAMSIDKQKLVDDALLGYGNVADTLVPDVNPWHHSIPASQQYKFDPAAARALLNSQGWVYDGTGANKPGATPLYRKVATGRLIDGLVVRF